MTGVREGPQDVRSALDILDQAALKLTMFTGLLSQIHPERELALGRAATDGLYFFLDGLEEEIEEATSIIYQAVKRGGKL